MTLCIVPTLLATPGTPAQIVLPTMDVAGVRPRQDVQKVTAMVLTPHPRVQRPVALLEAVLLGLMPLLQ